jgi:hypothetical protein
MDDRDSHRHDIEAAGHHRARGDEVAVDDDRVLADADEALDETFPIRSA